jgi:hypothetical protein
LPSVVVRELIALSFKGVEKGEKGRWIATANNKRVQNSKLCEK